eukprot:scaffold88301_cov45-Attheya_sp.AAC.2
MMMTEPCSSFATARLSVVIVRQPTIVRCKIREWEAGGRKFWIRFLRIRVYCGLHSAPSKGQHHSVKLPGSQPTQARLLEVQ